MFRLSLEFHLVADGKLRVSDESVNYFSDRSVKKFHGRDRGPKPSGIVQFRALTTATIALFGQIADRRVWRGGEKFVLMDWREIVITRCIVSRLRLT
ncbi:MAG TPA: hypothetical protein VFP14_01205 [Novosphingobium sp.]|nr:hypothetical protein [Novosphingobium sp.]